MGLTVDLESCFYWSAHIDYLKVKLFFWVSACAFTHSKVKTNGNDVMLLNIFIVETETERTNTPIV